MGGAIAPELPTLGRHGKQLVELSVRLFGLLESGVRDLGGSGYFSPQQPLGDLSQRIWHFRRHRFAGLHHVWMLFAPSGPLERLAQANGWLPQLESLRAQFLECFAALHRIRYFASEEPVLLGDHVELRDLFRKTTGRVTYLPGQPRHSAELDHGGLVSVGIQTARGSFVGTFVDPDTLELKKSVRFLKRDLTQAPPMPTEKELAE